MTSRWCREDKINRSVTLGNRRTTVALEPALWAVIDQIAARRGWSRGELLSEIERRRAPDTTLTSAARVFVVSWLVERLAVCEGRAAPDDWSIGRPVSATTPGRSYIPGVA